MKSYRLKNLEDIVWGNLERSIDPIPQLTWQDIAQSPYKEDAVYIYEALGGQGNLSKIRASRWHIELDNNVALQLDEQLSFNRYRNITLRSEIYREHSSFSVSKYRTYNRKMESECIKSGQSPQLWTSKAGEINFGLAAERRGDLSGNGAPAWKLRAFLEYWQDLTAYIKPVKVIRLSVWDELMLDGKLISINDILLTPQKKWNEALVNFITRKM